ncbi:hypothetical protein [Microbacterium dextranolyticum]|uniref:Uncharacterized protein n=1 Tax=Microbacterium dextranolyticum TaxID=36806 RepID=A0A9W6HLA4_9MICO|nr:hypothetical protein [Microbacterium dextranolyticum]MBM7464143.1 hypothetical protein [Microbacterium dextranolyticum]GLJ95138.1 hypothetical protein GCM10017591_12000 [Microbacterium dextranolyticum]
MTIIEADYADIFAGKPDQLGARTQDLGAAADAIAEATNALNDLVDGQKSDAIDAISSVAVETRSALTGAERRYRGTAAALKEFAIALAPIQATARRAIESAQYYEKQTYSIQSGLSKNQNDTTRAEALGQPTDDLRDEYLQLNRRLGTAMQSVEDARKTLHTARDDIRTAADRAIAAIETAIADGADSFADNWNQFWGGVGDVFAAIGKWVGEVLTVVVSKLIDIIAAVLGVLLVVLMLVFAIVAAIALIGVLLVAPELLIPMLLSVAAVVALFVATLVAIRVASDVQKLTPTVRPYKPDHVVEASGLDGVFNEAGSVDVEGGADKTVVKIEKIVQADGTVSWRVVLPSTQDWQALASTMSGKDFELFQAMKDSGAVNDVDSNMALVLFPSLRTQYERATLEAMDQAGIKGGPNGDPVMLVGFSQGGILAGHLAAYRSNDYNFGAVVVCGAPIDNMPIPDRTRVISVQHEGDPVPQLDFFTPPPTRPNWQTITDTAPGNPTDVAQIHQIDQYDGTLEKHLPDLGDVHDLDHFFGGSTSYTETEYYAWQE